MRNVSQKYIYRTYVQIIESLRAILSSQADLKQSKYESEKIKGAEIRTKMKQNPFYYVVWEESERHSVDFLLKIIPAKELML